MGTAYSLDLRQKAVEAVDRGEVKRQICKTMGIGRDTLDRWLKLREATGSLEPLEPVRRGSPPLIDDLEAFRAFAQQYGHLTLKEMADLWPEPVSGKTIGRALKRINFTRQQKAVSTENEMRISPDP